MANMSPILPLIMMQTFIDGKAVSKRTISQPIQQLTKEIKQFRKEAARAVAGSPYMFVEVIQGEKKIQLSYDEIKTLFLKTHGPESRFNVYTAPPQNQPFPFRVIDGVGVVNKMLETRQQAQERYAKEKKIYFSPNTEIGSFLNENITRARKLTTNR
jgi:hypothetical protein